MGKNTEGQLGDIIESIVCEIVRGTDIVSKMALHDSGEYSYARTHGLGGRSRRGTALESHAATTLALADLLWNHYADGFYKAFPVSEYAFDYLGALNRIVNAVKEFGKRGARSRAKIPFLPDELMGTINAMLVTEVLPIFAGLDDLWIPRDGGHVCVIRRMFRKTLDFKNSEGYVARESLYNEYKDVVTLLTLNEHGSPASIGNVEDKIARSALHIGLSWIVKDAPLERLPGLVDSTGGKAVGAQEVIQAEINRRVRQA